MEPDPAEDNEKKERTISTPSTPKGKSDKDVRPPTRSPTPRKSSSPAPTGLHEAFAHPHAPFMFSMHDRQPLSPALGPPGPYHRPPGEFRMDFRMDLDPFQRIPVPGMPGIGIHRPPFEHPGLPPSYPYPFKRHPPVVSEPPSTVPSQGGSAEDFYSQRLRQLAHAGPPSSPSSSPSPGQKSGSGIRQQQSNSSAFSPSTSQPPAPPSSNGSSDMPLRSPQLLPAKQKACEFCGKSFRFQSNLIVHRRSHTGDKPFRCSLCSHACTQASKLKRHMKIHKKAGSNSAFSSTVDQGTNSPSSTPDSVRMQLMEDSFEYDDNDMEQQVEDDAEAAALEEEMAVAELSRTQGDDSNSALQLSIMDDNEEKSSMDVNEDDTLEEDGIDEDNELEEECDSPSGTNQNETPRKSSLLSEVMENSGLKDISEYNEAFRQALKDQNLDSKKDPKYFLEIAENGIKEENNAEKSGSDLLGESSEPLSKKMKLEPIEIVPRDNNPFQRPESLYSNPVWFPPTAMPPDLFMRHTIPGVHSEMPRPHPLPHPNGGGLINHHSSAFKINSTRKHPGTNNFGQLNAPPTTAASTPPVPVKRRNDTCEFCGKIFKNCSNLTVHRRSHTGEKPYKCQLCSYACAQSSKLTRHMRTHGRLGKDVYRCKFCAMPFSVPSTLEKHMRKCVGNQSGLMDPDKSNSGMSPTGMSPVGMSPMGSGLSPVSSINTSTGGAFSPPSSGVPSPTSGTLAGIGSSQQGKPSLMDLDNGLSPTTSAKSRQSPQFVIPSGGIPFSPSSSDVPSPTSGTLASSGSGQQGKPTMIELDNGLSNATSVKSGKSPQSNNGSFALPSSGIPSPTSGTLPLSTSGTLP